MIISMFLQNWVWLIPLLLFLFFIVNCVIIPNKKVQSYRKEGIATFFFPVIGPIWLMIRHYKNEGEMIEGSKELSQKNPNQKVLVTNVNNKMLFWLQDPEYIKDYLQKQNLYRKDKFMRALRPLMGNGLVLSDGEAWKRRRRIVSSSFHFEFLKSNMGLIQDTTREFLGKLKPEDYKNYPVISKIQEITGEIVGRIFFGENLNNYTIGGKSLPLELAQFASQIGSYGRSPFMLIFGPQAMLIFPKYRALMRRIEDFRSVCFNIIQDRKKQKMQHQDLLASLLATQTADDLDQRFSDQDIVDEFITFFIAGMDTTGHLVAMALYNIKQHPEYFQILKQERDKTYNVQTRVTAESLQQMDLLHFVLKETLRFHCPITNLFGRVATTNHKICDLNISEGDHVWIHFFSIFFNPRFFENPLKFDPMRWKDSEHRIDPYAFIPFSAGPRNCIGQHLAIIEAKTIISEFLEKFEYELKEGYQLKMDVRFVYEPVNELLFDLRPINTI